VDPVALTEKIDFGPSPRDWAELSVAGQRAQQHLGFTTPGELGAVQNVNASSVTATKRYLIRDIVRPSR